jgi:hypothetical protein
MFLNLSHPSVPCRGEGDAPAANPASSETQDDPQAPDSALKETLLKAVTERARRAESSVVRSMAEQNGVPEDTLSDLLTQARAEQAETLPPEVRKRVETVDRRLLLAEVKSVGTELGLVDAEVALQLMDPAAVTVEENGTVTGVREALENLKQHKGYLFAPPARGAWAQRVSAGGAQPLTGVEEAFYRKNPGLRK